PRVAGASQQAAEEAQDPVQAGGGPVAGEQRPVGAPARRERATDALQRRRDLHIRHLGGTGEERLAQQGRPRNERRLQLGPSKRYAEPYLHQRHRAPLDGDDGQAVGERALPARRDDKLAVWLEFGERARSGHRCLGWLVGRRCLSGRRLGGWRRGHCAPPPGITSTTARRDSVNLAAASRTCSSVTSASRLGNSAAKAASPRCCSVTAYRNERFSTVSE